MHDADAASLVADLRAKFSSLPQKDRNFASGLIESVSRQGSASEKQTYWLRELAKRAVSPTSKPKPADDMLGLVRLFETAGQTLKRPSIVLKCEPIGEIRLAVAGEKARVPGSINVTENGQGGRWFGRIDRDGCFEPNHREPPPSPLHEFLRSVADHPAEVASKHGRLTGRCCFCTRPLENRHSVAVGYGPVCAENYGLPWGEAESGDLEAVVPGAAS